jgi:deoxycytidylate deaminase
MSSRSDAIHPIPLTNDRMSKFVRHLVDKVGESYNKSVHKHNTSLHIAFLVSRGKIISVGTNSIGSRIRGCCYGDRSLHAEMAALKNIHWSKIDGADMYIFRWKQSIQDICFSHPCHRCMQVLNKFSREWGLNRVYYSVDHDDQDNLSVVSGSSSESSISYSSSDNNIEKCKRLCRGCEYEDCKFKKYRNHHCIENSEYYPVQSFKSDYPHHIPAKYLKAHHAIQYRDRHLQRKV